MMNKVGDLRVWWNSNFGKESFKKEVKDIDEAKFVINLLTDYDLYLGDKITANACGLQEYVGDNEDYETDDGWSEYYNEEGQDIDEIMKNETRN